jgi:prefoldin subunit 5
VQDFELIAEQVSALGEKIDAVARRLNEIDIVIARLEEAALTTATAMQEIATHWDAVHAAMQRDSW